MPTFFLLNFQNMSVYNPSLSFSTFFLRISLESNRTEKTYNGKIYPARLDLFFLSKTSDIYIA